MFLILTQEKYINGIGVVTSGYFPRLTVLAELLYVDGSNAEASFALPNGIATNRRQNKLFVSEYFSPYIRTIDIE